MPIRLINVRDDGSLSLVEREESDIPPYAILSHTWGDDGDEVTYQDMIDQTGKNKIGYAKLTFCVQQVAVDDLQYFWIDTCCIDKSRSAELSEAITSMFRWYERSAHCYVYLSDVSMNKRKADDDGCLSTLPSSFKTSRWFTRGWTLQELLAPPRLTFFSREGKEFGDKSMLLQQLHEITQLPIKALQGTPLRQFPIADRLNWNKTRQTKRSEDMAYSLLGIFGISMSAIYGEGGKMAMKRLQREIRELDASGIVSLGEGQRHTLMESLRFDQIDSRHMTIKNAHIRTCKWILSSSEYRRWLDVRLLPEHSGLLWIKGKPGAGKSTLMKFAFANARSTMKDEVVVAYFFNARGEILERSTTGTYRSLLLQLFERVPALQCAFDSLGLSTSSISANYQWSASSLEMLFEAAIQNLGGSSVVCFIDALDECDEKQIREMIGFLERVSELAVSFGVRFKVCLSSRHYPEITIKKGLSLVLEGQEGHSQDITKYLESELKIGSEQVVEQIRERIRDKAAGIFMWVILVVNILNREFDRGRIHALKRRLEEIPEDLHTLFRDILTRDSRNQNELILCIQWVLFAEHPLSPVQLYNAILCGIDPIELSPWDSDLITEDTVRRRILDVSKGLTEITKSNTPKVQFIHESVRDFLLKEDQGLGIIWPNLRNNFKGQSHDRLKQCCAAYLDLGIDNVVDMSADFHQMSRSEMMNLNNRVAESFPFLQYAVQNVLHHADAAEGTGIAQKNFLGSFALSHWITLDNIFERDIICGHTKSASLLYILAVHNFANLIRSLPVSASCFDVEEEEYGMPFLAAVASRSTEAIGALVDMSSLAKDPDYRAPESYALYFQDQDGLSVFGRDFRFPKSSDFKIWLFEKRLPPIFARFLLTRKFDINEVINNETFLEKAVKNGGKDIIQVLLQTGYVDVNMRDKLGSTMLHYAATHDRAASLQLQHNRAPSLELLLDNEGIEVNATDNYGRTPLDLAVTPPSGTIINLLLDKGKASLDVSDISKNGLLWHAVEKRRTDLLNILLHRHKVDVNARGDYYYGTPIATAAKLGYEDIVELLLTTGEVDVNYTCLDGITPMHLAILHGHDTIVKLLLDRDDIIHDQVTSSRFYLPDYTALMLAVEVENKVIVEMLLRTGKVNVNAKSKDGRTLLSLASQGGSTAIVKLLFNAGQVDINAGDQFGHTPVYYAIECGHPDIAELLLDTGKLQVNPSCISHRMILRSSAQRGFMGVIQRLLATGLFEVNAKGKGGSTALMLAARNGHTDVVELLLATKEVDINTKDEYGSTALMLAANDGHTGVVKLLLATNKIDVDTKSNIGETALVLAAECGYTDIVKLLLATNKIDVDTKNNNGETALMLASSMPHVGVVELLLSTNKVDVHTKNNDGTTAFMLAAKCGYTDIVKLLLATNKIDVDTKNNNGETALMLAASEGYIGLVELLLATNDIDVHAKDKSGKTAFEHVHWRAKAKIVELLKSHSDSRDPALSSS